MSKMLGISVADAVIQEIEVNMLSKNLTNRSEYVEELIRKGLALEAQDID